MINNYINERLKINKVNDINNFINVIREECQKIILYSLSKTDYFNHVAFYGGTCLRIFHNLNRYSEDLDFNVIEDNYNLDLNKYMDICIINLESYGFKPYILTKSNYDKGEMRRRYISIPIYDICNEYFNKSIVNKEQTISIKLEVSTRYIQGVSYERKLLNSPLFTTILCFDYPSLFSGKLAALLMRNWRNREKGRDYYDYMFYLSNNIKFNQNYLQNNIRDLSNNSNLIVDLKYVKEMLINRFNNTDFNLVKNDIMTFVIDQNELESINKENFILSVDLLDLI